MSYEILGQRDPRWADTLLGNSHTSTIGQYGCLLTCYAMLAGTDPASMNDCRKNHGGFLSEPMGAWSASNDLGICAPAVRYYGQSAYWYDVVPDASIAQLTAWLGNHPAILLVDPTPGNPGLQNGEMHYVLAIGLDATGAIVINDPWHGDQGPLCPRYGKTPGLAVYQWKMYEVGNG